MTRAGMLGFGPGRVLVLQRGGTGRPVELPPTVTGSFTRKQGTGEASVVVAGPACAAALEELARVRRWEHEVAVEWAGEVEFVGPIVNPKWTGTGLELAVVDVSGWLAKWPMPQPWAPAAADPTVLAAAAIATGTAAEPSTGLVTHVRDAVGTNRAPATTTVGSWNYLADYLGGLGDEGLTWTCRRRTILLGQDRTPRWRLDFKDFATTPVVDELGGLEVNEVRCTFQESALTGTAVDAAARLRQGRLVHIEQNLPDAPTTQAAADAVAAAILQARRVPIHVNLDQDVPLRPQAPITMKELVPGSHGVLTGKTPTGRDFSGVYSISTVTVDLAGAVSVGFQAVPA